MRCGTCTRFIGAAVFLAAFSMHAPGGVTPGRNDLNEPLSLFFETKYALALPMFERIAARDRESAEALTWLAETYRCLGRTGEAIVTARKALGYSPCSSFAHLVLAQASYPDTDTVSVHVTAAAACDSTDPNAWLMMWGEAIRRADPALHARCLSKLVETGFFTEAALAYGRAELRTLPEHAILVTNGDMDTYPAQAVQVTEHFRPLTRRAFPCARTASAIMACSISGGRAVTMEERTLQWLEQFEANTEEGRVSTKEIKAIRNSPRVRNR